MNEDKYIFKIITMGDANSGKTLLCSRMCKTVPERGYMPTIGVEFSSVELTYQDKCIKMQLWDTAGQECFAPIVRNYYKKIAGIFFVIDLTSERSIKNIDYWFRTSWIYSCNICFKSRFKTSSLHRYGTRWSINHYN